MICSTLHWGDESSADLISNCQIDCTTVVYFAYVRHTSARASARSSNGSRKVSECKERPLRELYFSV